MDRDDLMRRALWLSVPFNLGAACLFAFPASALGQLAGLPPAAPLLYRVVVALFIALFGATYAWLALQPRIDRPLVAFSALGKSGVFAAILVLWLLDLAPARGVAIASGDLAFAGVFAWWLLGAPAGDVT
jgi:hypothetical protein